MYMKYEGSKPPTASQASRRARKQAPETQSTSAATGVVPVGHPVAPGKGVARPELADDAVAERLQQVREPPGRGVEVAVSVDDAGPDHRHLGVGVQEPASAPPRPATTTSALHTSR